MGAIPTTPNLLEAGATAATSNATGGPASNPAQVQQILQLLSNRGGGSGMSGPSTTAQSSIPPYQPNKQQSVNAPQIPTGHFQSVGENKRATKQAMFNNIASIANQAVSVHHERQVRDMSSMVTRIQRATEGKQQAEAILKSDPNNEDAKAQLKTNSDILSDIFSNPSNAKKLQKAFNVPLLGDKGKATPEYLGLMKALKEKDADATKQAGGAMASRFQNQMPSTQQLSPQMKAQAAAIKADLIPGANKTVEQAIAFSKNLTTLTKDANDIDARKQIVKFLGDVKDRETQGRVQASINQKLGRENAATINGQASAYRINKLTKAMEYDTEFRTAGAVLEREIVVDEKNNTTSDKAKLTEANKLRTFYSGEYDTITKQIKAVKSETDRLQGLTFKNDEDKQQLREATEQYKDLLQRRNIVIQGTGRILSLTRGINGGSVNTSGQPSNTNGAGTPTANGGSTGFDDLFEDGAIEAELKDAASPPAEEPND